MTTLHTHKGYKITERSDVNGPIFSVFDPRFKRDPAVYTTTSLDEATRWVDAYRDGQHWAMESATYQQKAG